MELNLHKIEFSHKDIKRNIKLPKTLSPNLIELIGIILGDGHLDNTKRKGNAQNRRIVIHGNLTDDIDYFKHINSLFKDLFGIKLKLGKYRKNELYAIIDSKAIFSFLKYLEIPVGNKGLIKIPSYIIKSKTDIFHFIRGLFDTDGSITFKRKDNKKIHYYPVLKFSSKSHYIIKQLSNIFNKNNIKNYAFLKKQRIRKGTITYISYIDINGKKNLKRWMKLIGFNNTKHLTKYKIWKNFGFSPPYTTLKQRKEILKGKINPLELY